MNQKLATAEWADPEAFAQKHAYAPGKFWLGRSPVNGKPLGYDDDRHVCLVSGSRSGKGTTTIVPNLCLWPGSIVVVDPKGENATVTAARRGPGGEHCEGMGQAVYVLDPFGAAQVSDDLRGRFNPLDALNADDPRTIDDAGRLADAIVVMNPESKDPFWDQSARSMVKAIILHVLTFSYYEGRRNLNTVRQLIARGDHEGVENLKSRGDKDPPSAWALLWYGLTQNPAFNGVVAATGASLLEMCDTSPKQFQSVLQVANRNTEFLDSPGMQACVAASDFKLSDLKTDPKGISVYLSLPQRYMGEHFRWLRMMIALIVNEMEATPGQPASGHRVLMCLDEFAGLKRMEAIENAVAQIAGYGVKLFFVLQSLEQLKATYKDGWETFLANSGLNLFYGIGDHFTREHVSKMIGDTELLRTMKTASSTSGESETYNTGTSSSESWGQSEGVGRSAGGNKSDNWKAMAGGLRNTPWYFRSLIGDRDVSDSKNWGESENSSTNRGGSDGTNESRGVSRNTSETHGGNESLHKRPLITPDEIGRYFGRVEDRDNRIYPGLALTLLASGIPSAIQRVNYFEDEDFQKCFLPHPDHAASKIKRFIPTHLVSTPFGDWKINGDGTVTDHRHGLMWMQAPVGMSWTGSEWVGKPQVDTWRSMTKRFGRGVPARGDKRSLEENVPVAASRSEYRHGYSRGSEVLHFAGHTDWRLPTLSEAVKASFTTTWGLQPTQDNAEDDAGINKKSHEYFTRVFVAQACGTNWVANLCTETPERWEGPYINLIFRKIYLDESCKPCDRAPHCWYFYCDGYSSVKMMDYESSNVTTKTPAPTGQALLVRTI